MKLASILFLTLPLAAQVAIQPANITISVPCQQQNLPKNGGKVKLVICPLTITPAPIVLPEMKYSTTLTPAQAQAIQKALIGGGTVSGVNITVTK